MTKNIDQTLTINITKKNGFYYISATASNIRVDQTQIVVDFTEQQKTDFDLIRTKPKELSTDSLIELGKKLYSIIFLPRIERSLGILEQKSKRNHGVRIQLLIEPPELRTLPWEIMHDGQDFIALRSDFPLVRWVKGRKKAKRTTVRGALKILYVWASPKDLPFLSLEKNALTVKKLLASNKKMRVDILPNATLQTLQSALLKNYHILCFAGHGDKDTIYLESQDTDTHHKVSAKLLGRMLEGKNSTRLLYLAACKTADTSQASTNLTHQILQETEIPAVVAMQYDVFDEEANILSARFFESLSALHPIDSALAEARKSIADDQRPLRDIFAPVLFLKGKTSNLFQRARNWLAILFATALVAALFGAWQIYTSGQKVASNLSLTNSANEAYAEGDYELALTLAYLANQVPDPSAEAQSALMQAAYYPGPSKRSNLGPYPVNSVAIHPETGQLLVGAGLYSSVDIGAQYGGSLILWDSITDETSVSYPFPEEKILQSSGAPYANPNMVYSVAFCTNGDYALSGGADGSVALWDTESGQLEFLFEDFTSITGEERVYEVACSPDGRYIYRSNLNGIVIWEKGSKTLVKVLGNYQGPFGFVPHNNGVLVMSTDGLVLIDINSWEPINHFPNYLAPYSIHPDGDKILSRTVNSNHLVLWDIETGTQIHEYAQYQPPFVFTPDGKTVISSSTEGELLQWRVETGEYIRRFSGEHWLPFYDVDVESDLVPYNTGLDISANGEIIFVAYGSGLSEEKGIVSWQMPTAGELWAVIKDDKNNQRHLGPVWSADISPDENNVFYLTQDYEGETLLARFYLINALTGDMIWSLDKNSSYGRVFYHPSSTQVFVADNVSTPLFELWNIANSSVEVETSFEASLYPPNTIAVSPDNNTVVGGGVGHFGSGSLELWDIGSGELIHNFFSPWGANDVLFSPDGQRIITATGAVESTVPENIIQIYDAASRKDILESNESIEADLEGHTDWVVDIDLSNDGTRLLSGAGGNGTDNSLIFWNMETLSIIRSFEGHKASVVSVAFGPQEKTAVSIAKNGELILWDISSGSIVRKYNLPYANIANAVISNDSKYILISDDVGSMSFWKIHYEFEELLSWVSENRYIPELSCSQKELYGVQPFCDE